MRCSNADMAELLFDAGESQLFLSQSRLKILIADDEEDVHRVTRLALRHVSFEGRRLEFLSAYSASEAKGVLKSNPDIAVALLDVVMENEDAGLSLVHYIRRELGNSMVRIILRTGYPGHAPEESVAIEYDINDYREKTELTSQRLITAVVTALRSYRDLCIIDAQHRVLKQLAESARCLFIPKTLEELGREALKQLAGLLKPLINGQSWDFAGFAAQKTGEDSINIYAQFGRRYQTGLNCGADLPNGLKTVLKTGESLYHDGLAVLYCPSENGADNVLWVEGSPALAGWQRDAAEMLRLNVCTAFDNIYLRQEIEATQKEVIFTLGEIVESRSPETGNHVRRVAEAARLLAVKSGLPDDEAELIGLAASLHDLGKLCIHESILNKPGRLTPEEFAVIKTHCELGCNILECSSRPLLKTAATIAKEHHERYDGGGYPRGLNGGAINLCSRIVALADVFDALGTRRVYKEAWPLPEIIAYIKEQRGKQFDPRLVDILLENIDEFVAIREKYPD